MPRPFAAVAAGSPPLTVAGRRSLQNASERAVVRAAQRGSEAALAELFRRHWAAAHRAAWLITHDAQGAEDVAQEAFLAAVRRLDSFDRRRPFGPWLHRIAVNRAIDFSRARAARREVAVDVLPEPDAGARVRAGSAGPSAAAGVGTGAGGVEPRDDTVVRALARLGPEQRAVVVLRHLLGYTPGEIAGLLDIPRGTVNSRMRRALDELAVLLEAEG